MRISNWNKIMLHFDLCLYLDSPLRICDALPLSTCREGGTSACGRGVSSFGNLGRNYAGDLTHMGHTFK